MQANLSYGAELVIAASVIYVITNTIYAHHERSLTLVRFIEFFASASLVAYIALTYLT